MNKYFLSTLFFILILGIGIFLRLDRLTQIPPSLSHDETAIAYNAYSILKTGKDEYGTTYPLLFRSFDDYKLPGMVYATIPAVSLFGLSELAARLPSAIFGILSILVMYGIAIELLGSKRWIKIQKIEIDSALFPFLMFSVSPWHINFSRQLFESNGAVFWCMLGVYFLLRSRQYYSQIFWAGISFVISLYFYYSVRLVIPFIGIYYVFSQWKRLSQHWKFTLCTALVCICLFFPMGKEMLSRGGMERISIVSVVNDPNYLQRRDRYVQKLGTSPTLVSKIMYNRRIALLQTIIENYTKNISYRNLFLTGTGTYGTLYPFEIVLIPLGFMALRLLPQFFGYLILIWLATSFLPGAFSVNQPNTLRTLIAAPVFSILSGLGLWYGLNYSKRWKFGAIPFFVVLTLFFYVSFPTFYHAYFYENPTKNALSFGDGYKQMIDYVKSNEDTYDTIVISGYYWRPYIFMLYWGNIDPTSYQRLGSREKYSHYIFTSAPWDSNGLKLIDKDVRLSDLKVTGKTLYILATPEYEVHKKSFIKISDIHGKIARNVYVAATSTE
ncbi:glycosyltransferase family 39 protein [Candidatus Woesebacteria bacterium]|nr:glycosyltransferase family 39 protein [Candidatus Woesebacteria bacterium]